MEEDFGGFGFGNAAHDGEESTRKKEKAVEEEGRSEKAIDFLRLFCFGEGV